MNTVEQVAKLAKITARRQAEFAALPPVVVAPEIPVQPRQLPASSVEPIDMSSELAKRSLDSRSKVRFPVYPVQAAKLAAIKDAAEQRFYDQQHAEYRAELDFWQRDAAKAERRAKVKQLQDKVDAYKTPRQHGNHNFRAYAPCSERVNFCLTGSNMGVIRVRHQNITYTFQLPVADLDLMLGDEANEDVQELSARLASSYKPRVVTHIMPYVDTTTWNVVDRDLESHPDMNITDNPRDFKRKQIQQRGTLARQMEIANALFRHGATIDVHMDLDGAFASLIETAIKTWHPKRRQAPKRGVTKVTGMAKALPFAADKYDDQQEDLQAVMVWTGRDLLPALLDADNNSVVVCADNIYTVPLDFPVDLTYQRDRLIRFPRNKQEALSKSPLTKVEWNQEYSSHMIWEYLPITMTARGGLRYQLDADTRIEMGLSQMLRACHRHWRLEMERRELVNATPAKRQHIGNPNPTAMRTLYKEYEWKSPSYLRRNATTTAWVDDIAFFEAETLFDDQFVDQRQSEVINMQRIDNFSFTIQGVEPIRSYQDGTFFLEDEEVSARMLVRERTQPLDTDMVVLRYKVGQPKLFKVTTTNIAFDQRTQKRLIRTFETPGAIAKAEAQERVERGVLAYAIKPKEVKWQPAKLKAKPITLATPYMPIAHDLDTITVYCGPEWSKQDRSPLHTGFVDDQEKYIAWLRKGFATPNSPVRRELKRLATLVKEGQPIVITGWPVNPYPVNPITRRRPELSKEEKRQIPAYLRVIEHAVLAIASK